YTFALSADDNAQVYINNVLLAEARTGTAATFYLPSVPAGAVYPIRIQASEGVGNASVNLTWQPPGTAGQQTIPLSATTPGYG
ncbi:UNVERIFIED_CONTAM: PA14 domain-containing protein, partial [Pseudomonas aeruginosa]